MKIVNQFLLTVSNFILNRVFFRDSKQDRSPQLVLYKELEEFFYRMKIIPLNLVRKKHLHFLIQFENRLKTLESLIAILLNIKYALKNKNQFRIYKHMLSNFRPRLDELEEMFKHKDRVFFNQKNEPKHFAFDICCYLCSRPVVNKWWKRKVWIQLNEQKLQIKVCEVCRKSLRTNKKANALFFWHENNAKHWTECEEFVPSLIYWQLKELSPQ